jgi:C-terminal processing protease CtpA/Prc
LKHLLSAFLLLCSIPAYCQLKPAETAANLESFEQIWRTVRDRHPDTSLNGLDWQAIHDETRPKIAAAKSMVEVRDALDAMVKKLGASHYAVIPNEVYKPAEAPPNEVGPEQKGKLVTFGNLPEQRVYFESRRLPGGAGYLHFNEFLDPVSIMPQVEAAMKEFANAPGIVLDLRGNPGGIGIMAMGIAGFFVGEQGKKLGEMKMREVTLKFVIYPRAEVFEGPLAILVDSGSASTSEILAQGMQDLGRARIFGTPTAGAALPSDIVRLPNGDGFQYAQASYTSEKGKVLEGAGVTPDEIVRQTRDDLSAGRDPVAEAAEKWILSTRR